MQDWMVWLEAVSILIGSFIGLILIIIHLYGILRSENKTNTKSLSYLSITDNAAILFYCLALFLLLPMYGSKLLSIPEFCPYFWFIDSSIYFIARMFEYLAFIIRLHIVYTGSCYQYNVKLLIFMSIMAITHAFGSIIVSCISILPYVTIDEAHPYLITCAPNQLQTAGHDIGLIAASDIMFCIIIMITFINPLRKIIKVMTTSKETVELIGAGTKFGVLVIVATLTTIVETCVVAFGSNLFQSIDHLTNIICIMLMTPYDKYRDYYSLLCCGAIKCSKYCINWCCPYEYNYNAPADSNSRISRIKLKRVVTIETHSVQPSTETISPSTQSSEQTPGESECPSQ